MHLNRKLASGTLQLLGAAVVMGGVYELAGLGWTLVAGGVGATAYGVLLELGWV